MCANHSNVALISFSIKPHCAGVEASHSDVQDFISWMQSTTTGETPHEKVVARQVARSNHGILAGHDQALDSIQTDNTLVMMRDTGQSQLH